MKRFLTKLTLVPALALFALSGCGSSEPGAVEPVDPTPVPSVAVPEPTLPGMPSNLCAEPPMVTTFDVWQDFMPGPSNDNLLHAALTLEIQCPDGITSADVSGSIVIKDANGSQIAATPLQLNSLADTATPGVKELSLSMQPISPPRTLIEGEKVSGTTLLTVGKDSVEVSLPEAEVLFTR